MADITRRIGLSLGADLCWPLCYEHVLRDLDLAIRRGGDTIRVEAERVTIKPYSLTAPCHYDVVIDRLTHWFHPAREWIKKSVTMDGLYVLNNPWSVQSMEKHTSYCAMMRLGMPVPTTWMIPPKEYVEDATPDLKTTLQRYARLFNLGGIGSEIGYPAFMKPYDGGGWRSVTRVKDPKEALAAYDKSGTSVMHLQAEVPGWDQFVRCVGFGPQIRFVRYDPSAPLHDRYTMDEDFLSDADREHLRKVTLVINAFFGWEFNSCEALRAGGVWHPIDFANACPDSQVTSVHYHFPWLVSAYLRWSIYCAVTKRPMRVNLDWAPFFKIADRDDLSYEDKLDQYAAIAERRFDTARFEAFCAKHLQHLDEVVWRFFGTEAAHEAIRQKVATLYPAHEQERFTELFWQRVQTWREDHPCP